jgi:DNA-damage-inducible protein J
MKPPVALWLHSGYIKDMSKTAVVRARLEPALKKSAEKIFVQLGLTTSEAIQLLYRQVSLTRSLPFSLRVPNKETQQSIRQTRRGVGVRRYRDKAALYKDLGL